MKILVLLMIVLTCISNAVGQSIHNATAIFIPSSITIYTNDVDNNGFIMNNGTIESTGDWNNESVYQGLGTVALTGTDQSIDNNSQTIHQLLISGGGTKSLNGKLTIDGSIEFSSGIVSVSSSEILLVRDDATIEGGSSTSFVDGPLTIEGAGSKFFPVGRSDSYYPVTLTDIRGFKPTVQVSAFKDLPNVATSEAVNIDQRVYWSINTIDGSFSGSPVSAPLHINIDGTDGIVFVTADDLDDEFDVIESDGYEMSNGITFVNSKRQISKKFFAVGGLPEKPVLPGYLSTTLSPNAANPDNRLVKMFGPDVKADNFHFTVVNRWGNVVFESTSLDNMTTNGWDGRFSGQILPAGAYPYQLSYVDRKGKETSTRGFITIIN